TLLRSRSCPEARPLLPRRTPRLRQLRYGTSGFALRHQSRRAETSCLRCERYQRPPLLAHHTRARPRIGRALRKVEIERTQDVAGGGGGESGGGVKPRLCPPATWPVSWAKPCGVQGR